MGTDGNFPYVFSKRKATKNIKERRVFPRVSEFKVELVFLVVPFVVRNLVPQRTERLWSNVLCLMANKLW